MKALSLLAPGMAQVIERDEPVRTEDDILLQVDMVGLCGTDLSSYRGQSPLVSYPRVLGHEIAATVLEGNQEYSAGTKVTVSPYSACGTCTSCRRGRENACRYNQTLGVQRDGAITERIAMPASKLYASSLPTKSLSLVEPLTVGFHAAARGDASERDTVAVFGCGMVGLGAISGAASRGARTIAIDLDETKLSIARDAGAAEIINSREVDVAETLKALTGGDGPDLTIEAAGTSATFRMAVDVTAFSGRVTYVGYVKDAVAYETKQFVQKELDIRGSRNAQPQDFRDVMAMLEAGRFPVERVISAVASLDDAPALLSEWSANPLAFTKLAVQLH